MGKADRIDWNQIKARWGSEVSELHLALLPKGFAQLVLAIQERFKWDATYRIGDYDFGDFDSLSAIVDLGLGGLTDTVRLADVIELWDEVEDLLRALQNVATVGAPCCENLGPVDETHDNSLDPEGDPPATWGDEPVADADEWEQLVCGAAHAYVDLLKQMSQQLDNLVQNGAIIIAAVAAILGILAGAGILMVVGYGTAAAVVIAITQAGTLAIFGDVAADLEAARSLIVCEVFNGDSTTLANAIESAISPLAWTAFYQFIDYSSARNIMLEGSHGDEVLNATPRSDCLCDEQIEQASWDFLSSGEGWQRWTGATEDTFHSAPDWRSNAGNPAGCLYLAASLHQTSPIVNLIPCTSIQLEWDQNRDSSGSSRCQTARVVDSAGNVVATFNSPTNCVGNPTWVTRDRNSGTINWPGGPLRIQITTSPGGTRVDNVTISAVV